jgi:hypothetical protein
MVNPQLDNLVRIGQLKVELAAESELMARELGHQCPSSPASS